MMHTFKFIVKEYFILQGGQIGFVGNMIPKNFPTVDTQKYCIQLFSSDNLIHVFQNIGEEIPIRRDSKVKARAFRTMDGIVELLKKNKGDLFIVGTQK